MLGRVRVDRFVGTSMNAQVSLLIAFKIQTAQDYPAGDRLLEDAGADRCSSIGRVRRGRATFSEIIFMARTLVSCF